MVMNVTYKDCTLDVLARDVMELFPVRAIKTNYLSLLHRAVFVWVGTIWQIHSYML